MAPGKTSWSFSWCPERVKRRYYARAAGMGIYGLKCSSGHWSYSKIETLGPLNWTFVLSILKFRVGVIFETISSPGEGIERGNWDNVSTELFAGVPGEGERRLENGQLVAEVARALGEPHPKEE